MVFSEIEVGEIEIKKANEIPAFSNVADVSNCRDRLHRRHSIERQSWLNEPLISREIRTNSSSGDSVNLP